MITSTSSVECNTESSSDSGTESDDNEFDGAQMPLPLKQFINHQVEENLAVSF